MGLSPSAMGARISSEMCCVGRGLFLPELIAPGLWKSSSAAAAWNSFEFELKATHHHTPPRSRERVYFRWEISHKWCPFPETRLSLACEAVREKASVQLFWISESFCETESLTWGFGQILGLCECLSVSEGLRAFSVCVVVRISVCNRFLEVCVS